MFAAINSEQEKAMDRRKFSLTLIGGTVLAGCGGGGGGAGGFSLPPIVAQPDPGPGPGPGPGPNPGPGPVPVDLAALTAFAQSISNPSRNLAPGQSNRWQLTRAFGINDGGQDQFDGALDLVVELPGTTDRLAFEHPVGEPITALGPVMGAADGTMAVSFTSESPFVLEGTTSAFLHCGPDIRLQQTLDLRNATGNVELTWVGRSEIYAGAVDEGYVQVMLRDAQGAAIATLYRADANGQTGTWRSAMLTAYAGQTMMLSFEAHGATISLDQVSVLDTGGVQYVTNGNFEAGDAGWTVPDRKFSQNVRSSIVNVGGLNVQRTFFTQPKQKWGRLTDTFHNPSSTTINASIWYESDLGADGYEIVYPTPGAAGKAISGWDGQGNDSDFGFVYGVASELEYRSATDLNTANGLGKIRWRIDISVPAGQTVTLVNFAILPAVCTGETAPDVAARATEVDVLASAIVNNFRTDESFRVGMTDEQLASLFNL